MKNTLIKSSLVVATLLFTACSSEGGDNTSNNDDKDIVITPSTEYCEFTESTLSYRGIDSEHADNGLFNEWTFLKDCITDVRTIEPCYANEEEENEFITSEYCSNFGLGMMNTSSAYVAGASGEGVIVAVLDSIVTESTHHEFVGQISSASKRFVYETLNDRIARHGVNVAGIIGASKKDDFYDEYDGIGMQGVAYNAEILSLGTLGSVGNYRIEEAINYAISNGASVINMSFGAYSTNYSTEYTDSIRDALASDITLVMSAGNERQKCKILRIGLRKSIY